MAFALEVEVAEARSVAGGDVNEALRMTLGDGRSLFVKTRASAPPGFFEREAEGLAWLAEAAALPTPEVVAVADGTPAFLALEWIEPGALARDTAERLGRGLATLHASRAPAFGWERDNFIGPLPQRNDPHGSWEAFYRERRLLPRIRSARDSGHLGRDLAVRAEAVCARLGDWLGPEEPPARLHGDLWSGNWLVDAAGAPWLIDPAVYGGHREMDLAMLQLFGGVDARFFAAYEEVWPLAPGARSRVALCQLYPLLVHVELFGAAYRPQLEAALSAYA